MISEREKRVLAGGALAVALLVGVGRGVPAWRAWRDAAVARAELAAGRAADAEAGTRGLRARIDTVEARQARLASLAPALLDGTTPAAAGASLSGLLSGAAARAGVRLNSVQVVPDSVRDDRTFLRVSLHADATGDVAGVARMLALIEGGPELLAVRELVITQPDPAVQGAPEQLHAELTVEGLALARPAADSANDAEDADTADAADAGEEANAPGAPPRTSGGGAP